MPFRFAVSALPAVGALLVMSCATVSEKSVSERPEGGSHSAEGPLELSLPRYPDKTTYALASSRGKVVLVDVWATWCAPCRESLPEYQALAKELAGKGLEVVTVNVDGETAVPKDIPAFITETKLTLPILLDTDAALSERLLKVKVMPTAFLVDRKGVVRHVHEGYDKQSLVSLRSHLDALLAEP